ncbi:MAG: NAD-dependent DNA ligase LigA [Miniphocaeibacter sp.]|uniref:NAD-dependent DNA ligase LigA n=1 Tax=Miniphocaeibacter sp. TaxID=3100973 RepID=UPI001851DE21|nr:NAD-dependent DNA ligase LigA [Gallicola sp.]
MDKISRIEELIKRVTELNYHYYTLDEPIVADSEYDKLYDELVALEKETGYVKDTSPTQRVGEVLLEGFVKHNHINPLYSLDKAQTFGELKDWVVRCEKMVNSYNAINEDKLPELKYIIELKFDGLTINLTYNNGKLQMAATRGNGTIGEEILPQVKTIRSVPLEIEFKGLMEVQGEGLMPLSELENYNKNNEIQLKNARNAAAGALRNLNPKETEKRHLTAFFYNIGYIEGKEFSSQLEMVDFIKENKFKVNKFFRIAKNLEEIEETINYIDEYRKTIDILTDGAVIKINDLKTREVLGYTNKFPRWAIAYKFAPEEVTTILKDVIWNVGRTGKVTPSAILEPVEIGDVTVQRATLNNYDDILRKKVELNSRVLIRRSNDVIPEILGVIDDGRKTTPIELPTKCPYCHTDLIKDGVHIFCPNSMSCEPQLVSRLVHFASRDAMNIDGLSEKTVEKMLDILNVRQISQIYDLKEEDLLEIPGFKEKKTNNLLTAIEKSKNVKLENFIYAIGIPNVGIKTSEDLAKKFKEFSNLSKATVEELIQVEDIGEITAEAIVEFFHDEEIVNGISSLLSKGIKIENPKESLLVASEKFNEKRIVITGSFENYKRKDLEKIFKEKGAKTGSSVSKNTDFLIVGTDPGSKLTKAQELGVQIIYEEDLEEFIKD